VRRNLKEAEGKALVRRTGIAYEADAMDKRALLLKVRYLYGNRGSRCGGYKREGRMHYPGRSGSLPTLTHKVSLAIFVARRGEELPEVSSGHSSGDQP
jgi:hypothetical protein